jgi:hypothetical protein
MMTKIIDTTVRGTATAEGEAAAAVATAMKGATTGLTEVAIGAIMAGSSSAMIDAQAILRTAGAMTRMLAMKARGAAPRAHAATSATSSVKTGSGRPC